MNSNFGQNQLSNYTVLESKGKGAYGCVNKAFDNKTRENVAMKKITIRMEDEGFPSTSLREISILREIDHPNVVTLKDVVIDHKDLYLIFEYFEMDLKIYIERNQPLDKATVKKFLYQIISGIADCHMKRIIHRDLKPANILLNLNGEQLKIADFGLARTFSIPVRPYSEEVVTLWYRAPQILLGSQEYTTAIDMWAIGCIFVQMITKRALFTGDNPLDQMYRIFRMFGTPTEDVWPGVTHFQKYKTTFPSWPANDIQKVVHGLNLDPLGIDLVNKLLRYDPNTRISAKAALQHPYFKDMMVSE